MKHSLVSLSLSLVLGSLLVVGCEGDDPVESNPPASQAGSAGSAGSAAGTGGSGGGTAGAGGDAAGAAGAAGEAGAAGAAGEAGAGGAGGAPVACEAAADDYTPRVDGSQKDTWPACISDSNVYTPVEASISTIARIDAFEQIATLLGFGTDKVPSASDFVDALSQYTIPEGLESRVARREDEHYPAAAKKCQDMTVEELAQNPDRCVGPAKIAPLLKAAFEAGAKGEEPRLNAARIEAGLLWFLYASVYKESVTCSAAPKDCDSSVAYYNGSITREDSRGLARYVKALDQETHDRVFDGNLAVRCWRDIDKAADANDLEPELHKRALAQLDRAAIKGVALIVKGQLGQVGGAAGDAAKVHVDVLGPVLLREAGVRDAAKAAALKAELDKGAAALDVAAATAALDGIFPCPLAPGSPDQRDPMVFRGALVQRFALSRQAPLTRGLFYRRSDRWKSLFVSCSTC